MSEQRRRDIVERVSQQGRVALADLAHDLDVSEMTVRRDLDELTDRGLLVRVRGGAVAVGWTGPAPAPSPDRHREPDPRHETEPDPRHEIGPEARHERSARAHPHPDTPAATTTLTAAPRTGQEPAAARPAGDPLQRAAAVTARHLAGATSLIVDAGPIALALAEQLAARAPSPTVLTVITCAPALAQVLRAAPASAGVRVLLTGGEARPGEDALVGAWAVAALDGVHAEHAVITPTAVDESGWWVTSPERAAFAAAAAAHADTVTALVTAGALGGRSLVRAAPPALAHHLVVVPDSAHTGGAFDPTGARTARAAATTGALAAAGVEVIEVDPSPAPTGRSAPRSVSAPPAASSWSA